MFPIYSQKFKQSQIFRFFLIFTLFSLFFLSNLSNLSVASQNLKYTNGMVSGVSKSQFLFFCEMGKNGENVATNTIDFGEQTEFYVINTKNENLNLGDKYTKTTKITGTPRFENHQTNFVIDLENDQIIVKNVQVINNLPRINLENNCVPKNKKPKLQ